jgi:mannose-6-phosphate isomerase-like protein (cupin superfamily)
MDTVHVTKADQGKHWLFGADVTTIKSSGRDTSGNLLVLDVTVSPGGGTPTLHRHAYSEVFRFLAGDFEVRTLDDNDAPSTVRVAAGDTVSIPSMAWHNFKNVGATPGMFIAIHSPAVMEGGSQVLGQPIDNPRNPPEPVVPPSEEEQHRMMAILQRYIEMLPPDKAPR